jgi:hypothetical protein
VTPTRTATPTATLTATATRTATPTATQTPSPTPTLAITSVRASKLTVRDDVTPPISPSGRVTQFRSGPYKGSASGVLSPVSHSAGDPTSVGASGGGAVLTVYNPTSGDQTVVTLPALNWSVSGSLLKEKYRYRSPKGDTTTVKISVGAGRLSLKLGGVQSFPLSGAPQGTLAVRLKLGTGVEYCGAASARLPAESNDTTAKFVAWPNSPAVPCPPIP